MVAIQESTIVSLLVWQTGGCYCKVVAVDISILVSLAV